MSLFVQPASKQQVKTLLDKHRPAMVAKGPSSSSEQKPTTKKEASSPPTKAPAAKKSTAAGKGKPKAKAGDSKKKGEETIEGAPLILLPNGKEQRTRDDEKLKVDACSVYRLNVQYTHVHVLYVCMLPILHY